MTSEWRENTRSRWSQLIHCLVSPTLTLIALTVSFSVFVLFSSVCFASCVFVQSGFLCREKVISSRLHDVLPNYVWWIVHLSELLCLFVSVLIQIENLRPERIFVEQIVKLLEANLWNWATCCKYINLLSLYTVHMLTYCFLPHKYFKLCFGCCLGITENEWRSGHRDTMKPSQSGHFTEKDTYSENILDAGSAQ